MVISGWTMRLWRSEVCEEKEIQPRRYCSDKFKLRIYFCGGQHPYGPPAGSPAPPPPGSAHRSPPASPQGAQCTDPVPRLRASAAAQQRLLGSLQPRMKAAAEAKQVEAAEQETDAHQQPNHREQTGRPHAENHSPEHEGDEAVGQALAPAPGRAMGQGHEGINHPFGQKYDANRCSQGLHLQGGRNDAGLNSITIQRPATRNRVDTSSRQHDHADAFGRVRPRNRREPHLHD